MRRLSAIVLGAALFAQPCAATSAGILGLWATEKNNGRVLIAPCGAALCGRVVDGTQLRTNPDQLDVNNPDPARRATRVMGLVILRGFNGASPEWRGGSVYDPQTGDLASNSTLTLLTPDRLKVEGCRLVFCRSEIWTRVN